MGCINSSMSSEAAYSAKHAAAAMEKPWTGVLKVFQTVSTVYGPGYIQDIRDDCYVVRLGNWKLAQGQSPTLYLQKDAITPIPGAFPGATIQTPKGEARLVSVRDDSKHEATLVKDNSKVMIPAKDVRLYQGPGFKAGDEVMTVYGQGYIESTRPKQKDLVVKLRFWKLAQGQSPTLYLHPSSCVKIHGFGVGDCAKTVWGVVRITGMRRDGTYICEALHWQLADKKPPTMYLAPEAFALLSIKP